MRYVFKKKIYIVLFSILDTVGSIIFFPIRLFSSKKDIDPKRILLIRADHIGDVINATVALRPLKDKFPNSRLDLLVPSWAVDLVKGDPSIDNVMDFDAPWFDRKKRGILDTIKGFCDMVKIIRRGNYDIAIDLRGDARHIAAMFLAGVKNRIGYGITGGGFLLTDQVRYKGKMHEAERNIALLESLGIKAFTHDVKLHLSADEENISFLKKEFGVEGPYVILHPVPGHSAKEWDDSHFARLAEYLYREKGFLPVFVGSSQDSGRISKIKEAVNIDLVDLSGKTRLVELGKLLKGASLFIGVDSGPAHIAAAMGAPTIILFSGANDPSQWAPKGENVKIIYPGKGKDLSLIKPEDIFSVVDKII